MPHTQSPTSFVFDFESDDNTMNEQLHANDTPILACLRAEKKNDLPSRTQHTASTLASSHFEDSSQGLDFDDLSIDFEEEDSLALGEIFDCDPLDAFDENEDDEIDYVAIDKVLRASGQIEEDDISELQDSHSTFLYEEFEEDMAETENPNEGGNRRRLQ